MSTSPQRQSESESSAGEVRSSLKSCRKLVTLPLAHVHRLVEYRKPNIACVYNLRVLLYDFLSTCLVMIRIYSPFETLTFYLLYTNKLLKFIYFIFSHITFYSRPILFFPTALEQRGREMKMRTFKFNDCQWA